MLGANDAERHAQVRANPGAKALRTVREIEATIVALGDEDLLDLQDIFAEAPTSALGTLASDEVRRRGLAA